MLYTVMPIEDVMRSSINKEETMIKEIRIENVGVVVSCKTGESSGIIIGIISSDPKDYMKSELSPGTHINLSAL